MNWNIYNLEVQKTHEDLTNLVIKAHWEVSKDGVRFYDVCTLPLPEDEFTPFEELTMAQVLYWVWSNGVDKAEMEAKVEARITELANPPIESIANPFEESPTEDELKEIEEKLQLEAEAKAQAEAEAEVTEEPISE